MPALKASFADMRLNTRRGCNAAALRFAANFSSSAAAFSSRAAALACSLAGCSDSGCGDSGCAPMPSTGMCNWTCVSFSATNVQISL